MNMETKGVHETEPCGCIGLGHAIHFCPLHAAAPELVAAAKAALWIITTTNMCTHVRRPGSTCGKCKAINDLESVLAKVKGTP